MRRSAPVVLVAVGLTLLLGSYVWYTQQVLHELRREASRTALIFARVYGAVSDPGTLNDEAALIDVLR